MKLEQQILLQHPYPSHWSKLPEPNKWVNNTTRVSKPACPSLACFISSSGPGPTYTGPTRRILFASPTYTYSSYPVSAKPH